MRRTLLVVVLLATACTTAPIDTTSSIPPPITTTTTTMPVGPGECGHALLTDERIPSTAVADEIIARFIADRNAGVGAEGCLTDEAAQTYASPTFPTCLYSCTDLAVLQLPEDPVIVGAGQTSLGPAREVLVTYQISQTLTRVMREKYVVQTIRGPGDQRQVLIGGVDVQPKTQVDDVRGRQVIDDFLRALSAGAWDVADSLLVGEGVTDEVDQRLPGIRDSAPEEVFAPFCDTALCGGAYEILDSTATSQLVRTYQVSFTTNDGSETIAMPVGAFAGRLTVAALPPEGSTGDSVSSLEELFFPGGYDGIVAFVDYNALQLGDNWYLWPSASSQRNIQVIGDAVAFDGIGGVELAPLADGTVGAPTVIANTGWSLAGTVVEDGEGSVLVTDGQRLIAYKLSNKELRTIAEAPADETIACASVSTADVLVTLVAGDSTTYNLYSFADGALIDEFQPDKADGCGVLSPDGTAFVYPADVSLHNPQSVGLMSVENGNEVDRWSVLAEARIGSATHTPLSFDGRYVIADLIVPLDDEAYVQNLDVGRRFVVDTQTGDQWMVDTSAQILFPPG